jgi:hypothetical protein
MTMAKPLITKSRRGLLHKKLGVPEGQPIPMAAKEKAAHSSDPALAKEGQFAVNFGHKRGTRKMTTREYLNSPEF